MLDPKGSAAGREAGLMVASRLADDVEKLGIESRKITVQVSYEVSNCSVNSFMLHR